MINNSSTSDGLCDLDDLSGLNSESELPHLSETIVYETDIAPHPFIGIHAGVSSGKNYFIDILARGYTDPDENGNVQHFPPQTILLVTSRRSKVNEALNDKSIKKDRWIGQWDEMTSFAYDDLDDFEDAMNHMRTIDCSNDPLGTSTSTIYQRYVPCTNAAIESYHRKRFMWNDSTTHLWNRFDIIVFDEAHTIRSDANYQSAPYFTMRLLHETYRAQKKGITNCKIIIMTGTPSILQDFHTPQKYHLIDRMTACTNVTPKKVVFIDREQSRTLARKILTDGKRCVFFFNRTRELLGFLNTIKKKHPELASHVAVSFSDEAKRKAFSKSNKEDFDRMVSTEAFLALNKKLPDDIQLFLTTERNKEGINIKNADIRTMFVESHVECSVVQMAGRLREGVDTLYIVTDSIAHEDKESKYEWPTTKDGTLINYYNQELQTIFKKRDFDPSDPFAFAPQLDDCIAAYITFVEKKHPYILFDPFSLKFRLYRDRRKSKLYYERQNALFDEAKNDPQKLCTLAHKWYPNAEVSVEYSTTKQVKQYIEQNNLLNVPITYPKQQELLAFINNLTGQSRKTLRPALKPFGYIFTASNNHAGCPGTIRLNSA